MLVTTLVAKKKKKRIPEVCKLSMTMPTIHVNLTAKFDTFVLISQVQHTNQTPSSMFSFDLCKLWQAQPNQILI